MLTSHTHGDPYALFEPATIGAFRLKNRIAMAPLTRNRAGSAINAIDTKYSTGRDPQNV